MNKEIALLLLNYPLYSRLLASASDDQRVKLWDAGEGAVLQALEVDAVIQTFPLSYDGTSLRTIRDCYILYLFSLAEVFVNGILYMASI
jgi:hypothetical protein